MFDDEYFMRRALALAEEAYANGEIPVGAVVVWQGQIVAQAGNLTERLNDVTAHAEMQAITAAANHLGSKYLVDCDLYVTLEPCLMCAGALAWAQLGRLVYGASDSRRGFTNFRPVPLHPKTRVVSGVLAGPCSELMRRFFAARRARPYEGSEPGLN